MTALITNTHDDRGVIPYSLRNANISLPEDSFKQLDREMNKVAKFELVGLSDLVGAGLVNPLRDVGVTISQYQNVSDVSGASVNMDMVTMGEKDLVNYELVNVPVPVFHKEFAVNQRQLEASRSVSEGIDLTTLGESTRRVSEKIEDMIFNGVPANEIGDEIYGYTTKPSRNTYTLPVSWTDASADIITDVINMKQEAINANKRGPFVLYVNKGYSSVLEQDYSAEKGTRTFRERILAISDIDQVKETDALGTDEVVLVSMDRSTVDIAIAENLNNFFYQPQPFRTVHRVQAVMAVRVKADFNGQCGIVHGTV